MDTQTGLTLFNAIATAGKNLYEIAQGTSKMEEKQQLMAVYEILMNLKRDAGDLEDTVPELKEKLRFKSGAFEFKNPFWFDHRFPDRALCPKCFSHEVVAPVSEPFGEAGGFWRKCLSCDTVIEEKKGQRVYNTADYGGGGGRWS
jgi:hypothetical protein